MFGLGLSELVIILVIVIIVFGASRLPMIGEGIGKGIKNFKQEMKKVKDGASDSEDSDEPDKLDSGNKK